MRSDGIPSDTNARAVAALESGARELRAGALDPTTRDLLLQVLGAIDSGIEAVEDATEVLESVIGITPESDFDDIAESVDGEGMDETAPRSADLDMLRRKAAALDLDN